MPAKKRCQLQGSAPCKAAALRMVGECPHCSFQFCGEVSYFCYEALQLDFTVETAVLVFIRISTDSYVVVAPSA
jgi:hypothetical protein